MKDSLIVLGFFVGGCLLGALGYLPVDLKTGNMSIYILYALMFQIGISIGSNKELKSMISQLRLKFLLIPLATIGGTLLFSALASLLLSRWSIFDCMAVGSGFAYYSLSSVLTVQGSFNRTSTGYGVGDNCSAGQYIQGNDGSAGCTAIGTILRQIGTYISCWCQFNGCDIACNYPLFRERDGAYSYFPWLTH